MLICSLIAINFLWHTKVTSNMPKSPFTYQGVRIGFGFSKAEQLLGPGQPEIGDDPNSALMWNLSRCDKGELWQLRLDGTYSASDALGYNVNGISLQRNNKFWVSHFKNLPDVILCPHTFWNCRELSRTKTQLIQEFTDMGLEVMPRSKGVMIFRRVNINYPNVYLSFDENEHLKNIEFDLTSAEEK